MSYIKDNFAPISFDSQKMEIAGIACLRKIASLKISPKIEKFSYQRSILKNLFFQKFFQESMPRSKVLALMQFSWKNIHVF